MANYVNFHWERHRDGPNDLLDTTDRFDQEFEEFEYYDEKESQWVDNRTPAMKEVHDELERLARQQELMRDADDAREKDDIDDKGPEFEIWLQDNEQISDNQSPSNPQPVVHPPVFEIR